MRPVSVNLLKELLGRLPKVGDKSYPVRLHLSSFTPCFPYEVFSKEPLIDAPQTFVFRWEYDDWILMDIVE